MSTLETFSSSPQSSSPNLLEGKRIYAVWSQCLIQLNVRSYLNRIPCKVVNQLRCPSPFNLSRKSYADQKSSTAPYLQQMHWTPQSTQPILHYKFRLTPWAYHRPNKAPTRTSFKLPWHTFYSWHRQRNIVLLVALQQMTPAVCFTTAQCLGAVCAAEYVHLYLHFSCGFQTKSQDCVTWMPLFFYGHVTETLFKLPSWNSARLFHFILVYIHAAMPSIMMPR
jgi:hypothetical protein